MRDVEMDCVSFGPSLACSGGGKRLPPTFRPDSLVMTSAIGDVGAAVLSNAMHDL